MAATTPKPDLLDTLTRRNRSVGDFLSSEGATTPKEVEKLLTEFELKYVISDELRRLCEEAVPLPRRSPSVKVTEARLVPEAVVERAGIKEIFNQEPEERKEVSKKAPKKHAKKDTSN